MLADLMIGFREQDLNLHRRQSSRYTETRYLRLLSKGGMLWDEFRQSLLVEHVRGNVALFSALSGGFSEMAGDELNSEPCISGDTPAGR